MEPQSFGTTPTTVKDARLRLITLPRISGFAPYLRCENVRLPITTCGWRYDRYSASQHALAMEGVTPRTLKQLWLTISPVTLSRSSRERKLSLLWVYAAKPRIAGLLAEDRYW